jgi:Dolichyl-phosphate-mannose-protein mannosyltransferase
MVTAAIPFLDWILAAYGIYLGFRLTLREAVLISATLAVTWLVAGTELLSLAHAITFLPILIWWLVPLPFTIVFIVANRHRRRFLPRRPRLTIYNYCLLAAIVFILGWACIQAIVSPPNNPDSQEYHLQRQVFWMQQHSVEHFPTSNLRQVAMPPLTEFAGLHLMILTGNDRYHNLLQWLALALASFAVTLTVRRFNRSATAQLLAALWTVTIPLAFLQASNTKNDDVVLMWICLLGYWVLLLGTPSRLRMAHIALIGLAFGAVALTKGTGIIFGFPLGVLAAFYLLRYHLRLAVPALIVLSGCALLLNAGHFARNERAFGSIAPDQPGIHGAATLGEEDHSFNALVSNLARNTMPHFVTPGAAWNTNLTLFIGAFHEKIGRAMDDPATTWMPGGRFRPYQFSWQNDEDRAAAPAHMLLLLLLPVVMIVAHRQIPWRAVVPLLICFIAGFVLFSFLLKWQNWHVRLIIPLPALIAPVFGMCYGTQRMRFVNPLAALFLFVALTPSLNCMQRPLSGPHSIFSADPLALRCIYHFDDWPQQFRDLANRLEEVKPKTVGFWTDQSPAMAPDYVMQRLLLDRLTVKPAFMSFNSALSIPGKPEADPDVLLVARTKSKRVQHTSTGTWYTAGKAFGRYTLYWPEKTTQSP